MTIQQVFCSVNDILSEGEFAGTDEARLYQAIREASDVIKEELGWFIPVRQTIKMRGSGNRVIYPFPPVLSLTGSIVNDETALVENTDFIFQRAMWANGASLGIELLSNSPNAASWCADDPDSVQIPCYSGLYSRAQKTGATLAATINSTAETLTVSNGAKVSPGMVLKLDDEQVLVTGWGDPTEEVCWLFEALDSTSDELETDDGDALYIGETIRIDFEKMRLTAQRSDRFSARRGWGNTRQSLHVVESPVDVYRTVTIERGVNGTAAAEHNSGIDLYRYSVPDNVLKLTKKMAVLGMNQSNTGYAGRSGDADQGTVYYHDLYPRWDLERLKNEYWIGRL